VSQMLELPDPLYDALQQAAEATGTTPQGWIAARLEVVDVKKSPANAKTLADLLEGRIGRIASSGEGRLSEDCGGKFAEHLQHKREKGTL
jgi:hypothetical protein